MSEMWDSQSWSEMHLTVRSEREEKVTEQLAKQEPT